MPSYKFKCPICQKPYGLKVDNPAGLVGATFTCSKCNYQAPMSSVVGGIRVPSPPPAPAAQVAPQRPVTPTRPVYPSPAPGPQNRGANMGGHTQVHVAASMACLVNLQTGDRFPISQGIFVLGRRSSDSQADIQLAPDPYISRAHAKLAAKVVNGRLIVQICSLKNENPVIVNGRALPAGAAYTLKPNDRMQFGQTQIMLAI